MEFHELPFAAKGSEDIPVARISRHLPTVADHDLAALTLPRAVYAIDPSQMARMRHIFHDEEIIPNLPAPDGIMISGFDLVPRNELPPDELHERYALAF